MTIQDLLSYVTVKEAVVLSALGYLGYKVWSNEQTIHLVAKRLLDNESKQGDFSSARSETAFSEDSASEFAFGFQVTK